MKNQGAISSTLIMRGGKAQLNCPHLLVVAEIGRWRGLSGLLVQISEPEGPFHGPGCLPGHSGRDLNPPALAHCCRLHVEGCVPAENNVFNEHDFF
jgi:hypothetical protein